MDAFSKSFFLFFVLLNPFIMSVYLSALVRALTFKNFAKQLISGGFTSLIIFLLFAWAGEAVFQDVFQVRFLSFQIFGGIIFLIVGTRLILGIGPAITPLKPESDQVSASIAMPFIVGPGTISAAVLAGTRLDYPSAVLVITLSLTTVIIAILGIKFLHDVVRERNEKFIDRYMEIAGRVTALFTGTFAVDMILLGVESWMAKLQLQ